MDQTRTGLNSPGRRRFWQRSNSQPQRTQRDTEKSNRIRIERYLAIEKSGFLCVPLCPLWLSLAVVIHTLEVKNQLGRQRRHHRRRTYQRIVFTMPPVQLPRERPAAVGSGSPPGQQAGYFARVALELGESFPQECFLGANHGHVNGEKKY